MAGVSTYMGAKFLDHIVGKTAMGTLPTAYLALFTAAPADDGTGGTEVSAGGYARKSTAGSDWAAAAASGLVVGNSNAAQINFATATADWTSCLAFGIYDALSSGNLLFWDYLGSFDWRPFSCTLASPGVLTVPGHGYANGNGVVVSAEFGGALPATAGSWTGVKTVASVSTDTFTAGVNTTGTGSGMVRRVQTLTVPNGSVASFNIGDFVLNIA